MTAPDAAPAAPASRAWQVVLDDIERDLVEGRLRPGDRLAPERELAANLGVGRSSVREAVRVLEVMGLIRTGTGSGPSSGAIVVAAPRGGLSQLLRLQVAAHAFPLEDVVETRLLLEQWSVASLARDADRDLARPSEMLDGMEREVSTEEFLAMDAAFHLALAEASGNAVVAATMSGLRDAIHEYVLTGARRIDDWATTRERLRGEHRAILAAIDRGDAATARALVTDHIRGYYAEAAPERTEPEPEPVPASG